MNEAGRESWRTRLIRHFLPWDHSAIRPAEVIDALRAILLDRKNLVEDAGYAKHVPNRFVIELGEENFRRNYEPIERRVVQQWQDQLQEHLLNANERLGRAEYRLGGALALEIRAAAGPAEDQARILYRLDSNAVSRPRELTGCLELLGDGRRWRLRQGVLTLGRDPACDISLDTPAIVSSRLVSSRHAYLACNDAHYLLFDGDPGGQPSLNGTYVNTRAVRAGGHDLRDGDIIQLAALVPGQPRPDTPGVAVFRFHKDCR
jgi:hypothetical protein